jgi:DNA polymerase III subunit beta
MQFIASSSVLLKNLTQISSVIGTNTILPILEDFLFEIKKDKLTITGTDLETVVQIEMEITSADQGSICIPAKILVEALKNMPNQPLSFVIDENYGIEITSDNGKYKIIGEVSDTYPKIPVPVSATNFKLTSEVLSSTIAKTIYAVSTDDLRPAMMGVYFELGGEDAALRAVGTDAHRLVRYDRKDVEAPKQDAFIIPRKPLGILKGILTGGAEDVEISYNENHFFANFSNVQFSCRFIDARFPDYKVVIPKDNPYSLVLNRQDFLNALRRVIVFSTKSTNLVRFNVAGSELHLVAEDIDLNFAGDERMACQYDGEDIQIAFNARFLIEMLSNLSSDEVTIKLSTPNKAGILTPNTKDENEEYLMLCMPLMVANG